MHKLRYFQPLSLTVSCNLCNKVFKHYPCPGLAEIDGLKNSTKTFPSRRVKLLLIKVYIRQNDIGQLDKNHKIVANEIIAYIALNIQQEVKTLG